MARPEGSRNAGYQKERRRLARLILQKITSSDGTRTSLRALAQHCDISAPTLRHYFKNRSGAIMAALEQALDDWSGDLERWRSQELGDVNQALTLLLQEIATRWTSSNFGNIVSSGLAIGLSYEAQRSAVNTYILVPLFHAAENRLTMHQHRQELTSALDVSLGARMLLAPVLLTLIERHQIQTDSSDLPPMDTFISLHVQAFLRAWASEGYRAKHAI